jgi:Ca2+-binding RTX toxin-like protein
LNDGTGDGIPDIYWTKGGQVVIWEVGGVTDTLTGGSGRDTFGFQSTADVANVITDFQAGAGGDMLDLQNVMSALGLPGVNGLAAGVVRTVQDGAHTHVQVDIDPGLGDHWATFATLQNVNATTLTPDDWLF